VSRKWHNNAHNYDTGMAHNISLRIDYGSKSGVLKETHGFVACSYTVYSHDIWDEDQYKDSSISGFDTTW